MNLIGLENAKEFFAQHRASTPPRALIISGKAGTGKFLLAAQEAAKLLGIAHLPNDITELTHPDLHIIRKDQIKVDDIRALQQFNQNQPAQAKYKIVLISNAETMNDNASNALLKLLEELRPSLFVWLVTANYHGLLATIRSRCHHLRVSPLSTEQTMEVLHSASVPEENVRLLALLTDNSPGLALKLAQAELPELWQTYWQCLATPSGGEKLSAWYDKLLGKEQQELWAQWPKLFTNFINQLVLLAHNGEHQQLERIIGRNHPLTQSLSTLNGNYLLQRAEEVITILRDLTNANLGEKLALTLVSTKLSQIIHH